jgi:hypothetical protein
MDELDLDLAVINAQKNRRVNADSKWAVVKTGCFSCWSLGKRKTPRKSDRTRMVMPSELNPPSFSGNQNEDGGPAQSKGNKPIHRSKTMSRSPMRLSGTRKRVTFHEEEIPPSVVQAKNGTACTADSAGSPPQSATLNLKCTSKLLLDLPSRDASPHTTCSIQEPANASEKSSSISQVPACNQAVRDAIIPSPAQSPCTVGELVEHWAATFKFPFFHQAPEQSPTIPGNERTLFF